MSNIIDKLTTFKSTGKFVRREIRLVLTGEQYSYIAELIPAKPLEFDADTYVNSATGTRISIKRCRSINSISFAEIEFKSESDYIDHIDEIGNLGFLSRDITFCEEYYVRNIWTKWLEIAERD